MKLALKIRALVAVVTAAIPFAASCGGGSGSGRGGTGGEVGAINPIGGTMNVASFVLPAGQTRTVTSDLLISSSGNIEIDGTLLINDGISVALVSNGKLTIKGAVGPAPAEAGKYAGSRQSPSAGRAVGTRDGGSFSAPYIVFAAEDFTFDETGLASTLEGITGGKGESIYISTVDSAGIVDIEGPLVTKNGVDGTDTVLNPALGYDGQVATDGSPGPNIEIGTAAAIAMVTRIAGKPSSAPGKVLVHGTVTAGNGGNGGNDPTGFQFSNIWQFLAGSGATGGSIHITAASIDTTGGTLTPGTGGNTGVCGSAAAPLNPRPAKAAPGESGIAVQCSIPVSGAGGNVTLSTMLNYSNVGSPGTPMPIFIADSSGGDGIGGSAPVAPGSGGQVYISSLNYSPSAVPAHARIASINITGGTGGASADPGHAGGAGGAIKFEPPIVNGDVCVVAGFTLREFGIGGAGFNGCANTPAVGSAGGSAGTVGPQHPLVSIVTTGWKLSTTTGTASILVVNVGNTSCSGGPGGMGFNAALGGYHGKDDVSDQLGSDGPKGGPCSGGGCNGGILAASYTQTALTFAATSMNNEGHVVGYFDSDAKYYDGTTTITIGVGRALWINDHDEVVGTVVSGNAWYWSKATGKQTFLQLPAGATGSAATCINNNGEIVGTALPQPPGSLGSVQPLYWHDSNSAPLLLGSVTFPGALHPWYPESVQVINDSHVIAGTINYPSGGYGVRWDSPTAAPTLLTTTAQLDNEQNVSIFSIDAAGNIFGGGETATANRHPMEWKAGTTQGIDLIPSDKSEIFGGWVNSINSAGTMVGVYLSQAVVFSAGTYKPLGGLIANPGAFAPDNALWINNCGKILIDTEGIQYILTPR